MKLMTRLCLAALVCSLAFFSPACKKGEKAILEDNWKLSEKAAMNQELNKLRDSLSGAKDDFERASIHRKIAQIESEKGDAAGSMKSALESIKYYPNGPEAHYLLGKTYLASGRFRDAENELATAIELDPKLAPAHFEMGNFHYKMRNYPAAIASYTSAVELDGTNFQAYNNMGVMFYQTGNAARAEQSLKKVMELKPDYASAYKNLGILYELKMGDNAGALAQYRKYLEVRPNAPDRAAVRLWIQKLGG
ncbi:MAG: tetratricopeptide repeat protein [Spirochaetes bacterium]|nr:MAG: tetratricopeptide repeat protein [Spirochaetota bacterium]